MERENIQREEFVLSYDGPAIRDHEMDIEVLATSLLSLKSLIERTNTVLNGRNASVAVKVKAGFQEGSLEAQIIVEYLGMVLPVLPQAVQTIRELIMLRRFLKGQPPQHVERTGDGNMAITNSDGGTQIFHGPVYNISGNATIISDLGKTMTPLTQGINEIKFITPGKDGKADDVTIASESDKEALIPSVDDIVEESTVRCNLEILTPNTDGSPNDWRFYDPENDVTFRASLADDTFLQSVISGNRSFRHGDMITVDLKSIKKTVKQRKRTTRIITAVLEYTPAE